jgi:hypothetical protein
VVRGPGVPSRVYPTTWSHDGPAAFVLQPGQYRPVRAGQRNLANRLKSHK